MHLHTVRHTSAFFGVFSYSIFYFCIYFIAVPKFNYRELIKKNIISFVYCCYYIIFSMSIRQKKEGFYGFCETFKYFVQISYEKEKKVILLFTFHFSWSFIISCANLTYQIKGFFFCSSLDIYLKTLSSILYLFSWHRF